MKFSTSNRQGIIQDNFNPPPGYYVGNDRKELEVLNAISQAQVNKGTTFSKLDRFPQNNQQDNKEMLNYHTSQGFDNIQKQKSLKYKMEKDKYSQNNYVSQTQSNFRKKTVSHKKNAQNLLIEMGKFLDSQPASQNQAQIIQMKQKVLLSQLQNFQNENPGPGAYNVKDTFIKPKTQTFTIRECSYQKDEDLIVEEPKQLVFGKGIQNEKQAKPPIQKQKPKAQTPNQENTDFNLELLLFREKRLQKGNENPPPGWYYNEEIFSQFGKLKEKEFENQCFDSRQPRFDDINKNNIPGPGEYDTVNINKVKNVAMPKGIQREPLNKQDIKVGVGDYQVAQTLVQRSHLKQTDFPSAFGSTQRRNLDPPKSAAPGPGAYNVGGKSKKPPKYRLTQRDTFTAKNEYTNEGDENLLALAVTSGSELPIKGQHNKRRSQSAKKQSHMFSSHVKRFVPQNEISTGTTVGPGVYEIQTCMKNKTFNQTGQLFSIDRRDTTLSATKLQTKKWVGPGTYKIQYEKD